MCYSPQSIPRPSPVSSQRLVRGVSPHQCESPDWQKMSVNLSLPATSLSDLWVRCLSTVCPVSPSYQDSLCSFMCSCGHCGHLCRPRRTTRHVLHACFPKNPLNLTAQQFFCPFQSQRVVLTDDRMHTPHRKSSGFSTERFRKRMTSLSRCT